MQVTGARAQDIKWPESSAPYSVTRSIVYKTAPITVDGRTSTVDLWMDAYIPENTTGESQPAVIYNHGGSFHRGSPRRVYDMNGKQATSAEEYCRRFAVRGIACFGTTYRVAPQMPTPDKVGYSDDILLSGFPEIWFRFGNGVRGILGLEPLDANNLEHQELMVNTVLSTTEDVRSALMFVKANSAEFNVDPSRIVLAGFSAGAYASWNVAHGLGEDVAGAVVLSGGPIVFDFDKVVTPDRTLPPMLLVVGDEDQQPIVDPLPHMMARYSDTNQDVELAWVAGFGHFYPAGALTVSGDGTRMSLDSRIMRFLNKVVGE